MIQIDVYKKKIISIINGITKQEEVEIVYNMINNFKLYYTAQLEIEKESWSKIAEFLTELLNMKVEELKEQEEEIEQLNNHNS